MDTDLAIAILKAVAALITAGLGIAALFVNYHNQQGKLTVAGHFVLSGICMAGMAGVVTSVFETEKARKDNQEQLARNETLLRQINRSLQRISDVSISAFVELVPGNPLIDRYIARLSKGLQERSDLLNESPPKNFNDPRRKGLNGSVIDLQGQVSHVSIEKESDLWPQNTDEERALALFVSTLRLSMTILKSPVDPEQFIPIHGKGDFEAGFSFTGGQSLSWDINKKRLSLHIRQELEKQSLKTSGKISSIVDLEGSQMFFIPHAAVFVSDESMLERGRPRTKSEIPKSLRVRWMKIGMGEGRELQIPTDKLRKTRYKIGDTVFSIILPKSEREFETFFVAERED